MKTMLTIGTGLLGKLKPQGLILLTRAIATVRSVAITKAIKNINIIWITRITIAYYDYLGS